MSAAAVWYCHACNDTHHTAETPAAHVGTARAQVGAAVAETTVYGCDRYSRDVFDGALAQAAAVLAQRLAYHAGGA